MTAEEARALMPASALTTSEQLTKSVADGGHRKSDPALSSSWISGRSFRNPT